MLLVAVYQLRCFLFELVCARDAYPKGLKWNCKKVYSCQKLAKRRLCGKKYIKAMNTGCNKQITNWAKTQIIRSFCR